MKILITGGAGFIGSHLVDRLLELNHSIKVIDNLKKPVHRFNFPEHLDTKKVEFIYGDVSNKSTLYYAMHDVEIIYHLAAYQDYLPDYSSFTKTNVVSTSLIYEIIEEYKLNIKKVIVASSQAVMGEGLYKNSSNKKILPSLRNSINLQKGIWDHFDEFNHKLHAELSDENIINPMNPYGMSKYQQEMTSINLGKRINIPTVAMRFSIVQGPRQSLFNAYSGACRIFSLSYFINKAPLIYEDGNSIRDYVNIFDVIDSLVLVLENNKIKYDVFNVGGGKAYTVKEFCNVVKDVFNSDLEPDIPGIYRFGDTRHIISDISKLKSYGWEPKRGVYDSVLEYKKYLETQSDFDKILEESELKMKKLNVLRKSK